MSLQSHILLSTKRFEIVKIKDSKENIGYKSLYI